MTDLDVLERIRSVTGVGTICAAGRATERRKAAFVWQVRPDVTTRALLNGIGPLLSLRRRSRLRVLGYEIGSPRSLVQSEGRGLTTEATAWVAGLLEAEGSFSRADDRRRAIHLEMTDGDIVDQYAALVGAHRYSRPSRRPGWKPTERAELYQKDRVAEVAGAIYPWLLSRRQAAVDALLAD